MGTGGFDNGPARFGMVCALPMVGHSPSLKMSIHVALRHVTSYAYDRPISLGPQVIRLRPAPHCRTNILSYSLKVEPEDHFMNWQQDPQSNYLARVVFEEKMRKFSVTVDLVAEMAVYNPFDFFLEPDAEHFPFAYDSSLSHELEPFLSTLPESPRVTALASQMGEEILGKTALQGKSLVPHAEVADGVHKHGVLPEADALAPEPKETKLRTIDFLVAINQRLWKDIRYLVRMEPGVQTPEETLTLGSGSCRDSAWLMCQILRHFGLASRFVSGYLLQLKPDVKSLDGPSGAEVDFTDLHAWCEVYLPGAGWIGLDPTSGLLAGEGHLPLAATPDPQSAAPVSGLVEPCEVEFVHEMSVQRIFESPRVTMPYTEEQWRGIDTLGKEIDKALDAGDVRLTMGGEPTFVSIDDMDGEEWNLTAMGPTKRLLSGELLHRLKDKFAPGGLLFFGQGKWYPGEPLPRWALGCYWRKDGVPVWKDYKLVADETKDYGHNEEDARTFAQTLAAMLGVEDRWLMPAYEDVYYYLWKERRLPGNVNPLKSNLSNPEERARLAKIFEGGLSEKVGYVIPLRKSAVAGWESGPWYFKDETLYLIPGDSNMGYRLPLDSLPWVAEADFPWMHPPDPMENKGALPSRSALSQAFIRKPGGVSGNSGPLPSAGAGVTSPPISAATQPVQGESAPWIIRTALCFEPREGRLHIFMPPVEKAEDYLELVTAIEHTAEMLDMPVILEGTAPPYDPRIQVFKITPDPGVIEVNLQPASTWDEVVRNTKTVYEEARLTRLGTEKFMVDGRHTGTGGGNHIVMGASTPADSPILRRPDLLRSMLAYWHNHPSLSYLFSGLFIGPTSQHPRVDEARNDALYELEIAFRQIPDFGNVSPWLVDRVFRHLLADVTGNTHRTEFSIDKLFSPDSSTGRLGLVELRSFEMPPHAEMSLAQHLLLRAAIATFWKQPYHKPLVRWGTELHDRFLLPHFIWDDFTDVLEDMKLAGWEMPPDWFAPHFEFRFPAIGSMVHRGVSVELRNALEPWHVLGEEGGAGGAVRYVDSSLERLQVKVRGLVDSRHILACNGHKVPLHPTGTVGEYVAAIRYRAWQPPGCLHPTIGVHTPLVFDLFDSWNGRSLGGCTHHVKHPGGLSYATFPINAYEAESRRLSRFFKGSHTPGPMPAPDSAINREFPFTLDLRLF